MTEQILFTIGDKEWQASLVSSSWELSRGLGGIAELPEYTGMLFDVGYERYIHVTTEPMLFPIDIAFFGDDLIVTEVYRNIGPGYLIVSEHSARYFFEVNAGELDDIEPGHIASFTYLDTEQSLSLMDGEVSSIVTLAGLLIIGGFVVSLAKEFASGVG